jgi:hypothetical protein
MNIFFRLCGGGFFLLHYSGFHFGYFYFLKSGLFSQQKTIPVEPLVISACLFFANQIITFLPDRRATEHKKIDFSEFMHFPYVRIIPLHLTIIFGGFVLNFLGAKTLVGLRSQLILLVFLFLKTAADVSMYVKQKKGFGKVPGYIDREGGGPYPKIKKTITGEVLVLTDGRVIPLTDNPELAKKVKSIAKFPVDVQQAVYEKLLSNESESDEIRSEIKCRCDKLNFLEGQEAHIYADRHLTFIHTLDGGSKYMYVCPKTGKKWVKMEDILRTKQEHQV